MGSEADEEMLPPPSPPLCVSGIPRPLPSMLLGETVPWQVSLPAPPPILSLFGLPSQNKVCFLFRGVCYVNKYSNSETSPKILLLQHIILLL